MTFYRHEVFSLYVSLSLFSRCMFRQPQLPNENKFWIHAQGGTNVNIYIESHVKHNSAVDRSAVIGCLQFREMRHCNSMRLVLSRSIQRISQVCNIFGNTITSIFFTCLIVRIKNRCISSTKVEYQQ